MFLVLTFSLLVLISSPSSSSESENDPFESVNRGIFKFNNQLDDYLFKPAAKGWRAIPDIPRKPLSNLASTAKTPVSLANAILQLNKKSIGDIKNNPKIELSIPGAIKSKELTPKYQR